MKTILVVVVVALLIGFYAVHQKNRPTPVEFKSTDEFIQGLSSEAVKDALSNNQIKLDYSVDSIKNVEVILGKLNDQYEKAPSSIAVKGLSAAYGAYIGEVIRKAEPDVHWKRDDEMGEKIYPLVWGGASIYPMAWCQKRIENGDEDNVWMKYLVFKSMHKKSQSRLLPPSDDLRGVFVQVDQGFVAHSLEPLAAFAF